MMITRAKTTQSTRTRVQDYIENPTNVMDMDDMVVTLRWWCRSRA